MIDELAKLGSEALYLAIWISLPALVCALVAATVVAALQAWTQLQEPALNALPRLLAVGGVLLASLAWIGTELQEFTVRLWEALGSGVP